jgi:cell wall assembly regulator SMI1
VIALQQQYQSALEIIDAWRAQRCDEIEEYPPVLSRRNPGAAEDLIELLDDAVREVLKTELPRDLVALLRLHDGEVEEFDDAGEILTTFPFGLRLLSTDEIHEAWRRTVGGPRAPELDEVVEHDPRLRWSASPPSPHCIPFAGSPGLGYNLFVDLNPGPEGAVGQVVYNATEIDMECLAASIPEFLQRYATALERGEFEVEGEQITTDNALADALEPEG